MGSTTFLGFRHCSRRFHARLAASRPSPSRVLRLGLRKSHAPAWRSDSFESWPVLASRLVLRFQTRSLSRVLSMTSFCSFCIVAGFRRHVRDETQQTQAQPEYARYTNWAFHLATMSFPQLMCRAAPVTKRRAI